MGPLVFNNVKTMLSLSAQSTSSKLMTPLLAKVFSSKAPKRYWSYYCAALVTICCVRVERVPYSGKYHLGFTLPELLKSVETEKYLKKTVDYDDILPPSHPKTIRATTMARKIAQAMRNGLGLKKDCSIRAYVPSKENNPQLGSPLVVGVSKDIWKLREKKIMDFGTRFSTKHLEVREWRIIVVDSPTRNASMLRDGTMVIYSGSLNASSDEELAHTIAHEFGHAIAQHYDVELFRMIIMLLLLWLAYQQSRHVQWPTFPVAVTVIGCHLFRYFFYRRDELGADHIGMMVAASAGYDPKEAPKRWRKHPDDSGFGLLSTHPSNSKRAMSMEKPENMNKAITV